jgi:3-oxoadipate CoA-transferase alpha subunit
VKSDWLPSSKRGAYPKRSVRSLERPTRPSSPSSTGAAVSNSSWSPKGTLAERIRCGGAGLPAFYTPTAVGTPLAEGKELREFEGKQYVMERGLRADFTLIKARTADVHGNLLYNKTARNFSPIMAMAADTTIVQAADVVDAGDLDPECIVTPGIFVDRVVGVAQPAHESELIAAGVSYP